MSSTHKAKWITDPTAIRTIVLMRAMRPGDEVRLKDCGEYGIRDNKEGKVAILTYTADDPNGYVWNTARWPKVDRTGKPESSMPVALEADGYYLALWNIAAWRRPLKEEA